MNLSNHISISSIHDSANRNQILFISHYRCLVTFITMKLWYYKSDRSYFFTHHKSFLKSEYVYIIGSLAVLYTVCFKTIILGPPLEAQCLRAHLPGQGVQAGPLGGS